VTRGAGLPVALVLVAACGVAAPGFASDSRLVALGGAGSLEPASGWMVDDPGNVFAFPSILPSLGSSITAEFGTVDAASAYQNDGWGMATIGRLTEGRKAAVALLLRRPESSAQHAIWSATMWAPAYAVEYFNVRDVATPEPRIGIGAGFELAPGHQIGALVAYGDTELHDTQSHSREVPTIGDGFSNTDLTSTSLSVSAGYGYHAFSALRSVEAAAHYRSRSFDNHFVEEYWPSNAWYSLKDYRVKNSEASGTGATARAVFALSDALSIAAAGGVDVSQNNWGYVLDQSFFYSTGPLPPGVNQRRKTDVTTSTTEADAGVAIRWAATGGPLLFAGAQFSSLDRPRRANDAVPFSNSAPVAGTSIVTSDRARTTRIPLSAGAEWNLLPSLVARCGLSRDLVSRATRDVASHTTAPAGMFSLPVDEKTATTTKDSPASPLALSFGWAWMSGGLTFEGVVRTELLFASAYAISGIASQTSTRLTATYRFGGDEPQP